MQVTVTNSPATGGDGGQLVESAATPAATRSVSRSHAEGVQLTDIIRVSCSILRWPRTSREPLLRVGQTR